MKNGSLKLFSIFHGNLQFSSIPKSRYKEVIEKSYWPLLRLLDRGDFKVGIEFPALSLLEIERLDYKFIEAIKRLMTIGKVEFIGSGYTQSIFPLIPYSVNIKNIKLGMDVYRNYFKNVPNVFYVNEQVISSGTLDVYLDCGIKNLIIDFDNTAEVVRKDYNLRFYPCLAKTLSGKNVNIIWGSSISFQKFQRVIFDEISSEDYLGYLEKNRMLAKGNYFPFYSGDWEVFGFSPKGLHRNFTKDFSRMHTLFKKINEDKFNFVLPLDVLKTNKKILSNNLFDAATPISTKKQVKYNLSRWALSGKNSIFRNTDCYKIYNSIKSKKIKNLDDIEKNLITLWGSDYRTNTTVDKNKEYEKILKDTYKLLSRREIKIPKPSSHNKQLNNSGKCETKSVSVDLDLRKGATIKNLKFKNISNQALLGLVPHGFYNVPEFSADWFSGHCLFETADGTKYTDLVKVRLGQTEEKEYSRLSTTIRLPIGNIEKVYSIYKNQPKISLNYTFYFKNVSLKSARVGNITIKPDAFNIDSFWFSTLNGGKSGEMFKLAGKTIKQDEIESFRISSRGCLGATDGWIAAGDNKKGFILEWDKSQIAACPIVHFEKIDNKLYGRIQPSIAESDETGFPLYNGKFNLSFVITGFLMNNKFPNQVLDDKKFQM